MTAIGPRLAHELAGGYEPDQHEGAVSIGGGRRHLRQTAGTIELGVPDGRPSRGLTSMSLLVHNVPLITDSKKT